MAIDRNINKKTGCGTSQMAEEHTGHLLERQDNKTLRSEPELGNIPWTTYYSEKDDYAGLDMFCV